ncbi:hypothetical protein ACJX0J_038463, partial [Zea mays]
FTKMVNLGAIFTILSISLFLFFILLMWKSLVLDLLFLCRIQREALAFNRQLQLLSNMVNT